MVTKTNKYSLALAFGLSLIGTAASAATFVDTYDTGGITLTAPGGGGGGAPVAVAAVHRHR